MLRRADLVDVSAGVVAYGLSRGWLRGLFRAVPRDGIYGEIARIAADIAQERPETIPSIFWQRSLLDDGDRVAGADRGALGDAQLLDLAGAVRGDLVLHLHRLDHADHGARVHLLPLLHRHSEDGALKR